MLHFTEAQHDAFCDLRGNAEFEWDYDGANRSRNWRTPQNAGDFDHKRSADRKQKWKDALHAVKSGDHYILAMTGQAFGFGLPSSGNRSCDFAMHVLPESVVVLAIVSHSSRSRTH